MANEMKTRMASSRPDGRGTWKHTALGTALAMLVASSSVVAGPLRVQNGRFVDQAGGDVVLRGFNLSQWHKIPPFRPNQDPALFAKLSQMGVNAVRLQFNWEAYETAPGVYDETYLDYYAGVVTRARAQNVYVIVDIHQDLFSRWTLSGCGEGFPQWAIPAGTPVVATPDNGAACSTWPVTAMFRRGEMDTLFNNFMAPGNMAREHYLIVLEKLARRFVGTSNVIGYEPLNEPFGSGPALVQLNRDAAARVRAIDPSAIVFVCPEMWSGLGIAANTALTNPNLQNLVFAPHYYDVLISFKMWAGQRYEPRAQSNRDLAKTWGAAVVLGEFGGPPSAVMPTYMDMIYSDLEKFGESGMQWGYTPEWNPVTFDGFNSENLSVVDDQGQLRNNFTPRPYVRRTAAGSYGQWQKSAGDWFQGPQISYSWNHEPARGATELFVPAGYFGGQAVPNIVVSPSGAACALQGDGQLLRCTAPMAGKVTVTVSPAD